MNSFHHSRWTREKDKNLVRDDCVSMWTKLTVYSYSCKTCRRLDVVDNDFFAAATLAATLVAAAKKAPPAHRPHRPHRPQKTWRSMRSMRCQALTTTRAANLVMSHQPSWQTTSWRRRKISKPSSSYQGRPPRPCSCPGPTTSCRKATNALAQTVQPLCAL